MKRKPRNRPTSSQTQQDNDMTPEQNSTPADDAGKPAGAPADQQPEAVDAAAAAPAPEAATDPTDAVPTPPNEARDAPDGATLRPDDVGAVAADVPSADVPTADVRTTGEAPGQTDTDDASRTAAPSSDEVKPVDSAAAPAPVVVERKGGGLATVISIVALLAAGGAGYLVWQQKQAFEAQNVTLAEQRAAFERFREDAGGKVTSAAAVVDEVRRLSERQEAAVAAMQGRVGSLEALAKQAEGQRRTLEALYQEFNRSREERVITEVEQAVVIASQQLHLASNIEAALVALQGAEARLAISDNGQYVTLRRAIVSDIETLRSLPQTDIAALGLRLEHMQSRIDALPLAYVRELDESTQVRVEAMEREPDQPYAKIATDLVKDVWGEIKTLVRVEKIGEADPALMAPEQATFLRENLKVRLLTARVALLSRDAENYRQDLAQAAEWMSRYFDMQDPEVTKTLTDLRALSETQVAFDTDIPLESLKELKRILDKLAAAVPVNAGESSSAAQ